ncbi:MAG TPA: hypothetical protein VE988_13760 [Gemmataceae bacterium]|nr:hypothetical protein [Gemmataceae bacterium]
MIELTDEQRKLIDDGAAVRVQENGREYVLMRPEVYERLIGGDCDDISVDADGMDRMREESEALLDNYGKDT